MKSKELIELDAIEEFEEKNHRIEISYDKVKGRFIAYTDETAPIGIGVCVISAKTAYISNHYSRIVNTNAMEE